MNSAAQNRRERRRWLRQVLLEIQGPICVFPDCDQPWTEMMHIEPIRMGGRESADTIGNVAGACKPDHDRYDGRDLAGRQELLRMLMRYLVRHSRHFEVFTEPPVAPI